MAIIATGLGLAHNYDLIGGGYKLNLKEKYI